MQDYVKRQKKRLGIKTVIDNGIARAKANQANDE